MNILLIGGISLWTGGYLFAQEAPSAIPFTAHIEKRFYKGDSDNETPLRLPVDYARRSDLSYVARISEVAPDGSKDYVIYIVDTRRRQVITLEPFTKSRTTLLYGPREFEAFTSTQDEENCPVVPDSNEIGRHDNSSIRFGHSVRHVHSFYGDQPGVGVDEERWVLPDLRCFPIKRIDVRGGARTEAEVESLTEVEPSPALFTIPVGYVERSPLAMETIYKQKFNGVGFCGDRSAKSLDATYWKHQRTGGLP